MAVAQQQHLTNGNPPLVAAETPAARRRSPQKKKRPGSSLAGDTEISFGSLGGDGDSWVGGKSEVVAASDEGEAVAGSDPAVPDELVDRIGLAEFTNDEKFQLDNLLQRVQAAQAMDDKHKERLREQLQSALTQASSVQEDLHDGLLYKMCELCGGRLYPFNRRYTCHRCDCLTCPKCVHVLHGSEPQCHLCYLEFVTEAQSGEWFLAEVRRRSERAFFGPDILRASLRRERRRLVSEEKARRANKAAAAAAAAAEAAGELNDGVDGAAAAQEPALTAEWHRQLQSAPPNYVDLPDSRPVDRKAEKKAEKKRAEKKRAEEKLAEKKKGDKRRDGKRPRSEEPPPPTPPVPAIVIDAAVEDPPEPADAEVQAEAEILAGAAPEVDAEVEVEVVESLETEEVKPLQQSFEAKSDDHLPEGESEQAETEDDAPEDAVAKDSPSVAMDATDAAKKSATLQVGGASSNLSAVDATSQESVMSNISETEDSYHRVQASGEVEVSLQVSGGSLTVLVHQCRNLARIGGRQPNPYVKTYLLPDKTKRSKRRTHARRGTSNPTFGSQPLVYPDLARDELNLRTLQISVWHSVPLGANIFMGEFQLPMEQCRIMGGQRQWLKLADHLASSGLSLPTMMYQGDLALSVRFECSPGGGGDGDRGRLEIWVRSCSKLAGGQAGGSTTALDVSPYVKCYLLPDKHQSSKRKSKVAKCNPNPEFNAMFTYSNLTPRDLRERSIELTVWDHVRLGRNDFLGGVRLNIGDNTRQPWMDARGHEQTLWTGMLENPNKWIDGSLILRPNMDPWATHIAS